MSCSRASGSDRLVRCRPWCAESTHEGLLRGQPDAVGELVDEPSLAFGQFGQDQGDQRAAVGPFGLLHGLPVARPFEGEVGAGGDVLPLVVEQLLAPPDDLPGVGTEERGPARAVLVGGKGEPRFPCGEGFGDARFRSIRPAGCSDRRCRRRPGSGPLPTGGSTEGLFSSFSVYSFGVRVTVKVSVWPEVTLASKPAS